MVADATLVVAPDSGTAHMAVTQNTPVIGLYAHSNPNRTGPYRFQFLTIYAYQKNLQHLSSNSANSKKWGVRLKGAHLMEDIALSEVIAKADEVLSEAPNPSDNNS